MNAISDPAFARPAFYRKQLAQAIVTARIRLQAARAAVMVARGKMAKIDARRAIRVASAALADAEAALVKEDMADRVAEQVQRHEIVRRGAVVWEKDASGKRVQVQRDVVYREPRVEVSGSKRAELQPALERLKSRGAISIKCYKAGRRYREAWEKAGLDAFPCCLGASEGARSAPGSGNRRIEDAVGSSIALSDARRAVGVFGTAMLEHLIVEGLTISSWAEKRGESEHVGKGILIMVLERLAGHWDTMDAASAARSAAGDAVPQIRSLHGTS